MAVMLPESAVSSLVAACYPLWLVDRRNLVPVVAVVITIVCAGVIYLSRQLAPRSFSTTVVVGSAAPASNSSTAIGPHLDESTGMLTVQPGDQVDSNGVLVGVTSVVAPYTSQDPNRKPASGEFLLINVEVHNSLPPGGESLPLSLAANFELQDSSGQVYQPSSLPGTLQLVDGPLGPGATLDGALAYDVPLGRSYRLLFKSPRVSNGAIAIDLGRR